MIIRTKPNKTTKNTQRRYYIKWQWKPCGKVSGTSFKDIDSVIKFFEQNADFFINRELLFVSCDGRTILPKFYIAGGDHNSYLKSTICSLRNYKRYNRC